MLTAGARNFEFYSTNKSIFCMNFFLYKLFTTAYISVHVGLTAKFPLFHFWVVVIYGQSISKFFDNVINYVFQMSDNKLNSSLGLLLINLFLSYRYCVLQWNNMTCIFMVYPIDIAFFKGITCLAFSWPTPFTFNTRNQFDVHSFCKLVVICFWQKNDMGFWLIPVTYVMCT